MRKVNSLLLVMIIYVMFSGITVNAMTKEYDDGIFRLLYDDEQFNIETTEKGTVHVEAINMPDFGNGHNTVLGCLKTKNSKYFDMGELTSEELGEFQRTFVYEMCRGLFEIDNGIAIIADGYSEIGEKCEYFMVLSDGTECYITVYNYGEIAYYSACRLCPYTSDLNDGYRSVYKSIELSSDKNKNSNNEELEESIDWESKYNTLLVEHETLQAKYNVLSREHEALKGETEEENSLTEETETAIYEKESEQSGIENAEEDSMMVVSGNSQGELFDPSLETDIVFEEVSPFFDSKQNYNVILDNINNGRIEELKSAIGNYKITHQDDKVLLEAILSCLNEYGDFENLVCEIDTFSGEANIYFDGYTEIDADHYVYPHSSGIEYNLGLGFVGDTWLFAEDMILKRESESVNDGIWFSGKSYDFERDIIGGGTIREYKEETLYDKDVNYLLDDMSEKMVIRFEADNGEKIDYVLTDQDKSALQNVAKYVKLRNCISDIRWNSELYYTEIPENSIVSGAVEESDYKNPFFFDVELVGKYNQGESYDKCVYFEMDLTNNYEKEIREINGKVMIMNSQGKQIMQLYFNFTDLGILPSDTLKGEKLYYECSDYKDADMELYNILYEDIVFVYMPTSVEFSDGTLEKF